MEPITYEKRWQQYDKLSPVRQELYAGETIGSTLAAIFKTHNLPETKYKVYAVSFGDMVLGFLPEAMFANTLRTELGLADADARTLADELIAVVRKAESDATKNPPAPQPLNEPTAAPEDPAVLKLTQADVRRELNAAKQAGNGHAWDLLKSQANSTLALYFKQQLATLPQTLRDHAMRASVPPLIGIIAQKHILPPEKALGLENEIFFVLMGLEPVTHFEEGIVKELLIPGSVAKSIATDINASIFTEVAGELDALAKRLEKQRAQVKPVAPRTPAPMLTVTPVPRAESAHTPPERSMYGAPPPLVPLANTPRYEIDDTPLAPPPRPLTPPPPAPPITSAPPANLPKASDPYREPI